MVDRGEQVIDVLALVLLLPQARQTPGSAEFPTRAGRSRRVSTWTPPVKDGGAPQRTAWIVAADAFTDEDGTVFDGGWQEIRIEPGPDCSAGGPGNVLPVDETPMGPAMMN